MDYMEERPVRLGFWAVLLFGVFAWAPAAYPGYWQALEGFIPVFNVAQSSAIAGVATSADLWRGTGSATFLPAQPLLLLDASPTAAVRGVWILIFILGGLGMYVWLRPRWGDRAAGLAGLIYMLWPPLLATAYVRGSLADAMILALLPMALAGAASFAETGSRSAAGVLVLSVLWMWRVQAGLAVAATLLLLVYVLAVERALLAALAVGVSGAAGFTSLIPLWHVRGQTPVVFFDHFVYIYQLFNGGWEIAPSVPGWQDGYPFQLGFVALAFSIGAVWLWRRDAIVWRGTAPDRLMWFCLGGALALILLSLNVSAPLWRVTRADRLFTYPWQTLLLAGPLLAALAGSLPALSLSLRRPLLWTVLTGLVVLASYPYLTTAFTQVEPPPSPRAIFGGNNEIVLLNAALTEDRTAQEAQLDVTWQVLQPLPFDYNVFFQALAEGEGEPQVMSQLDAQPLQGERPATTWVPGEIFTDTYTLDLAATGVQAADVAPGLRYDFGYYDWRDGSRLPIDGGIDDKLILYGR